MANAKQASINTLVFVAIFIKASFKKVSFFSPSYKTGGAYHNPAKMHGQGGGVLALPPPAVPGYGAPGCTWVLTRGSKQLKP
ncbi:hypothetical protein AGMMS49940_06790 [Spirochaetia bacterium]|nr:hypothetical protein AGMMS49940_06790 [Spirochaetia bacterium]